MKFYRYTLTTPVYGRHYPTKDLVAVHENPVDDPTGRLSAILDYSEPVGRYDMERYGMTEFPYWLACERYLPLSDEPLTVRSLENIRDGVAAAITALADYHPLGDAPHGMHVGGIVDRDIKKLDLYRVYDTVPPWALMMVQELIDGTDPKEFAGLQDAADVRTHAERLHEAGRAKLFGE